MKKYPAKIFYCYSHKDEELRDRLEIHLKMLERQNLIKNWHDRKIISGKNWSHEISRRLDDSDIVLLLLSPDFLASDYCYEVEMKKALDLHASNQIHIVPILLRVCDWKNSPFSRLQGLPLDMIPVLSSEWDSIDEAFHNITEGLKDLIQELFDSYQESDYDKTDTSVLVESKIVDVELIINREFSQFTLNDQKHLIDTIEKFLNLSYSLKIKTKKKGSVILRIELDFEDALKLKYAIEDQLFEKFSIISVALKDKAYEEDFDDEHFLELDFSEVSRATLVLRSLNHKLRQRILPFIYREKSVTITDIYVKLGIEQSIISQHLAILRRSGIIDSERQGKFIYYKINTDKVKLVANAIKLLIDD